MPYYEAIVTGAQGNIGSRIVKNLGQNSLAITRENWNKIEREDFQANSIVHCAFDLKNNYSQKPCRMIESNILSTGKVLEIAKAKNIKKVIFISSCAVYGNSSDTKESTICIPASINGQVKLLNEKIIDAFCTENNLNFHILRVFNLFGGDDRFSVVSKLLDAAIQRKPFTLNNDGLSQRDFIHVDDVCKVIDIILKNNLNIPYLNIGTGRALKIIDLIRSVTDCNVNIELMKTFNQECEYSRANLDLFKKYFNLDFINVLDYLKIKINKQMPSKLMPGNQYL